MWVSKHKMVCMYRAHAFFFCPVAPVFNRLAEHALLEQPPANYIKPHQHTGMVMKHLFKQHALPDLHWRELTRGMFVRMLLVMYAQSVHTIRQCPEAMDSLRVTLQRLVAPAQPHAAQVTSGHQHQLQHVVQMACGCQRIRGADANKTVSDQSFMHVAYGLVEGLVKQSQTSSCAVMRPQHFTAALIVPASGMTDLH